VAHAVALLGRDELEAILISVAAGSVLPPLPAPGFVPARFWLAAARRAACAKSLAEIVDRPHRAASFTAALLQDVALPVLAHHGPPEHADVVARWHLGHAPLESLERERFNWDHARVGGWICAAWGLPLPICRAVAAHHGPPPEDDGAWQGNEPLPASTLVAAMPEIDDDGLARHMAGEWAERLGIELDEAAIRVGDAFQAASSLARELSPGPGATAPDAGIDAAT